MEKAFDSDWKFLKTAVEDLENFVLAPQDSWPIAGSARQAGPRDTGRLTIGNLMLAKARLDAMPVDDPRQKKLQEANLVIEQVRTRWRANWARKAEKEFKHRLNLWSNYLHDLLDDTGRHASGYPDAVRWRLILKLLLDEVDGIDPAAATSLNGLDRRLQMAGRNGAFVWEPEVEPAFPLPHYWYLYLTFS
jgi:hypothetical protein